MTKGRMEPFSDGVLAVIITIMVLEIKPPLGTGIMALHAGSGQRWVALRCKEITRR
jgi:uncharacterized membrane protein